MHVMAPLTGLQREDLRLVCLLEEFVCRHSTHKKPNCSVKKAGTEQFQNKLATISLTEQTKCRYNTTWEEDQRINSPIANRKDFISWGIILTMEDEAARDRTGHTPSCACRVEFLILVHYI